MGYDSGQPVERCDSGGDQASEDFDPKKQQHLKKVLDAAKTIPQRLAPESVTARVWFVTSASITKNHQLPWEEFCRLFSRRQALVSAVLVIHRANQIDEARASERKRNASIGRPWGSFSRPTRRRADRSGKDAAGNQGSGD